VERINLVKPSRYLAAFVLATVVFVAIFLIAYSISYFNYQGIYSRNSEVEKFLSEFELSNETCIDPLLYESSDLLDVAGARLGVLERRLGKNHWRVLEQKKLYTRLELAHFNVIKGLNEICDSSFLTVLFFYSNTKELEDASERVGYILNSFKNSDPERVMIYSFDANLDAVEIVDLKKKYGVTRLPATIINENDIKYLRNIHDLEEYV
jgi:hypothetical protein